ncbi:unnamed protein product, partial [marine sediment metagenome]
DWGLRDYGDETKTIWGGDKDCKHKWITYTTKRPNASGGDNPEKLARKGKRNFQEFVDYNKRETKSDFCSLCGAWYGQLGLEPTLDLFLGHLLQITAELKRVLKKTGVMFWNHGDCYGGSGGSGGDYNIGGLREGQPKVGKSGIGIQPKCLALQNYRLILKMINEQGWILRNSIIWNKPNHMPSSVKDRFSNAYEPVFMLVKQSKSQYYYNIKTGLMADKKPKELKERIDWDWDKEIYFDKENGIQKERLRLDGKAKPKKISHWRSLDYWFDLDAVRMPHTLPLRQRGER